MSEDEMDRIASQLVKQAMVEAAFDGMEREVEFGGYRYTVTPAMQVTAAVVDRGGYSEDTGFDPPNLRG